MSTTVRLLSALGVLALSLPASAADANLLRYKFQPGQELTYHSESQFSYGEGDNAGSHGTKADWTVWVLRANPDGSSRLVLREKSVFSQTRKGEKHEQPPQTSVVYADVFPDGRVLPNKSIQYRGHPGTLFPRLPQDATAAKAGWEAMRDDDKTTYKPIAAAGGAARFEATTDSPMNKIYLSSSKITYTFDPAKGFVTKSESENTQGYGFNGKGTGTTELTGVKTADPAALKELAASAERYFAAVAAYEDRTGAAEKAKPAEAKELLAQALAGLKAAAGEVKTEELRADLDERAKQHERMEKYYVEAAERRAKVVGQPAAEFETADVDGKKVKLSDLRGQVVVLDFWYRGCGWCVKSMPQLNQLADDFAGKPVALLGMNTDRKEEDAKFVIEKMGLKYPTLKAEGLPEKFGVQGFPTFVVIDPQGVVRELHVGYSPTLREDMGKVIRELLAQK